MAWRAQLAEGQALVIFALFSLVLIGCLALAIDAGNLMAERRQTQSAADAGAMAAAKAMFDSKAPAEITATGQGYATYDAGGGSTAVVNRPPTSGAYAGNTSYVQVTVTKSVSKYFVGAVYKGSWQVSASATAGIDTAPGDYALITLNKTKTPGIYMNGNTTITLTGNNASAMSNTNIAANGGPDFKVKGTIDANGSIASKSSWVAPGGIHSGRPQVADPLAGMAAPSNKGTARTFGTNCNGGTLQPGWYKDQSCTIKNTVTLQPGAYYFENTDIQFQNTNSRIQGSGVVLYFDVNSSLDTKNGEVHLTAPSTAPTGYRTGLVFWYVPCTALDMQGNGELYFQGVFYAPCSDVTMHGNPGNDTVNGQVFVGTFTNKGTSDLAISYNKYVQTTRPAVFLVE